MGVRCGILLVAALFGQVPDPSGMSGLAGGAGWVGTGLLGGVLSWLLFIYLPAKDKQFKEMVEFREKSSKEERMDFREALERIVAHCEKDITELAQAIHSDTNTLAQAIHKDIEMLGSSVREFVKSRG